jgi:hypothetical protein
MRRTKREPKREEKSNRLLSKPSKLKLLKPHLVVKEMLLREKKPLLKNKHEVNNIRTCSGDNFCFTMGKVDQSIN